MKPFFTTAAIITLLFVQSLTVQAQSTSGQAVSVPAQGMDVQLLAVPGSSAATYLNVTVDASTSGGGNMAEGGNGLLRLYKVEPWGKQGHP